MARRLVWAAFALLADWLRFEVVDRISDLVSAADQALARAADYCEERGR